MKKATDIQTKGVKDVGGDTEVPLKSKNPLSQAMITSTMTVRNFKKEIHDERDDENRNDEKNGRHEGSRTQGNVQ